MTWNRSAASAARFVGTAWYAKWSRTTCPSQRPCSGIECRLSTCDDALSRIAFRLRDRVGASELTQASPMPSRASMHGLGSIWIATPLSSKTFTPYSLPVSPAHHERWDYPAETRSVWSAGDVEREVRSTLGVRSGHEALMQRATEAPSARCWRSIAMRIRSSGSSSRSGRVFEAAAMLVERRREVALRAPDAGLDPQQQAAYAQLGAERISRSSRALRVPASRVCSATSRRRTTRPGFG